MRIALFGSSNSLKTPLIDTLTQLLRRRGATCFFVDGNSFEADLAISIGGDGTFLRAAAQVGAKNIPILGINMGRLGFLADISPEEIESAVNAVFKQEYQIEERTVLQMTCADRHDGVPRWFALNEIAVLKRDSSSMITIHTAVNGKFLNTYRADGLIVSTPTGSTAYSLSVGGPIIVPQSNTIVITPVAPHSLNIRPIIIRDDWEISLDVESRSHHFLVTSDGRSETLKESTRLLIRKAEYTVKVMKHLDQDFFGTLRAKMMWGADGRR